MANIWADQVKAGDEINAGDVGDTLAFIGDGPRGAWLTVEAVYTGAADGFTDYRLRDEDGNTFDADIPSAERVTVRRA